MRMKRILIVDDEPAFLRHLKLNLERTGRYIVKEVNDATRALEAVRAFLPDLILLDMVMPKLHGRAFACQMRSTQKGA